MDSLPLLSFSFTGNKLLDVIASSLLASTFYTAGLGIYRLFFSPVARFPGPKLAALTQWYETYYDVYLDGKFLLHLEQLHEIYGPIVRINPWEVHINDPEIFETIYSTTSPFDKVPQHTRWTNSKGASQSTVVHTIHRSRRAAIGPLFSKRQISLFAPEIQARANKLSAKINSDYAPTPKGEKQAFRIDDAYGCFAADVVTEYSFAREYKYLESDDFTAPFVRTMSKLSNMYHKIWHFPLLLPILSAFPQWYVEKLNPMMADVFRFRLDVEKQIKDIIDDRNQGYKDASHPTVFRELLDSDLPAEEKTLERLRFEGTSLVSAGMETTRWVLSVGTYHVLNNPEIAAKLKEELLKAWPDVDAPPKLETLEQLPYLTAIIQEALRLSYGVPMRLPRVSKQPLQYKSWTIPPGTPFSMSNYFMHHNEDVFPDSHTFDPSRWLADPITGALPTGPDGKKLLTRYMGSFSRGTRACLGIYLAYAELYIALATVLRRCDLSLVETTDKDVRLWSEKFVTQPHPDSKGVRVVVN